jgi:omega-amidase
MMRIALGQMDVATGQPEANVARAAVLAGAAAQAGAQLLLLPELWLSGFDLARAEEHARSFAGSWQARWASLARSSGLYIGGSALASSSAGRPANTALLFSPQGDTVAAYRKVHLFAPMQEKQYLAPGDSAPTFDLPWGRTAFAICYDLRFPELFRHYVAQGAVLVLLPAQWPRRRMEHRQILLRARAIENQFFLAACNRAGTDEGGSAFAGHSAVIGPWGEVLIEGGEKEDLLLVDIDLEEVVKVRREFPVLADRREAIIAAAGRRPPA